MVLLASSLIPQGSLALNPKILDEKDKLKFDNDDNTSDALGIELENLPPTGEGVESKDLAEEAEDGRVKHRTTGTEFAAVVGTAQSRPQED